MNQHCRLGLLGLGKWARRAYLPNLALMDDVQLVAVSTRTDANRAAAAEWLGPNTAVLPDWRELLKRSDLDGVIVATAPESHCEIAASALDCGLPVLCEKPLALTLDECDRLLEAERQSLAFLQVGLEFRHAPVLCQAKKWVAEGRLGQVTQVWCSIFRDKRDSPRRQPERWVENGGVFVEFLCHYFDMLTALSGGVPERVSGVAGQALRSGAWDHGWLNIEYDSGALGHVGYSLLCPRDAERLELGVAGDRAVLEIMLGQGRLVLQAHDGDRLDWQAPPVDHPSKPYPGSFEQLRHFIGCLRTGEPSPINGVVGRQMLSLGYGAERAVRAQRSVALR